MLLKLIEILTPNIMALFLLLGMVRISENVIIGKRFNVILLKGFIFLLGAGLLLDTLNRGVEGYSGQFVRAIVVVTSYLLFLGDILFPLIIILFLLGHIYGYIPKGFVIYGYVMVGSSSLLLLINCFVPIVFNIGTGNSYSNGPMYFLFVAILVSVIPAGLIAYGSDKNRTGSLEFFSPALLVLPVIVGLVLSELCLDIVSTILPMLAVSAVFMFFSLLHEALYRDKLTGLYNRFYMDQFVLQKHGLHRKMGARTMLMMDVNHFKSINDEYGHEEGDAALKAVGTILAESVVGKGTAVRYAGDEFLVILNTTENAEIEGYIARLRETLTAYNLTSGKKYAISISVGYEIFDASAGTLDQLMNSIDRKMYEDKEAFYASHRELERRK